jgi:hypothetical protein
MILHSYLTTDKVVNDDDDTNSTKNNNMSNPRDVWREHLAFSLYVLINSLFASFYSIHGIFRQRKEDLFNMLLTAVAISMIVIFDFFNHGDQYRVQNVTRLIVAGLFFPFNFATVFYVITLPEWQEVRRTTMAVKVRRSRFFALQKLAIQCIVLLYVLLEVQGLLNLSDRFVLLCLSLLGLVSVSIGWRAISRCNRKLLIPFLLLGVPLPILVLAFLGIRGSAWMTDSVSIFLLAFITICILLLAKMCDSYLVYQF